MRHTLYHRASSHTLLGILAPAPEPDSTILAEAETASETGAGVGTGVGAGVGAGVGTGAGTGVEKAGGVAARAAGNTDPTPVDPLHQDLLFQAQ